MSKWKKRDESINTISDSHMKKMGVSSTGEINHWWEKAKKDEFALYGVNEFLKIVRRFINGTIYIMGDYDVDGITATAILLNALRWAGYKNVKYRIPKRITEGFGMNMSMIDEITEENCLIITVDNGIAAADVVAYAKSKGHTVIVTDHHEPNLDGPAITIPNADLVIDPKIMPGLADFDGYCGAGIAFKLARALLRGDNRLNLLLPLAMFGTVCDQMKLCEENYFFVRYGLTLLNKTNYPRLCGISTLERLLPFEKWDEGVIGYTIGPMLNAAERMGDGDARYAVDLLTSENAVECESIVHRLKITNEERKIQVAKCVEHVYGRLLSANDGPPAYPIIEYVPEASEGIIGIIAGNICEKYKMPTGIFTDSKDGTLKGSFRAPEGYSIKDLLEKCKSKFVNFGGHASAAGATVRKTRFEEMKAAMQQNSPALSLTEEGYLYDICIDNEDIVSAIDENLKYGPFGQGNEDLIFKIANFVPIKAYGEWKKVMKNNGIKVRSDTSEAVAFRLSTPIPDIHDDTPLNIYGTIAYNYYKGVRTPQIIFKDIEIA